MVKLSQKQIAKTLEMINKYKYALSLDEFVIKVKPDIVDFEDEGKWAEVEVDVFENEMKMQFSDKFMTTDTKRQENIIVHELFHGLLNYYKLAGRQGNSSESYEYQEEMFINRLTKMWENK